MQSAVGFQHGRAPQRRASPSTCSPIAGVWDHGNARDRSFRSRCSVASWWHAFVTAPQCERACAEPPTIAGVGFKLPVPSRRRPESATLPPSGARAPCSPREAPFSTPCFSRDNPTPSAPMRLASKRQRPCSPHRRAKASPSRASAGQLRCQPHRPRSFQQFQPTPRRTPFVSLEGPQAQTMLRQ